MERSNRITALIYGYAVCLVAIIVLIFSSITIITALLDRQDLLRSGWSPAGSPSLASYENYKMDMAAKLQTTDSLFRSKFIPSETDLKKMYEAAKEDKLLYNKHNNNKNLTIGLVLVIISMILFITHWRWARRLTRNNEADKA